ncbi:MAG: electron transfer flavoprotein subunit beta/FixA family protein [Planctomycetota bacterium]|jgi:electron transfer flavoprotein beta subunit
MNVAVLIKRVPDTAANIKVAGGGKSIDPSGVQYVLNPYDEYAVEAGLQLKEKAGAGSVVVLCLGPKEAQSTIRTALAMGADSGVHVQCDEELLDTSATARTLAAEIGKLDPKPDMVLAGRMSVDGQSFAVGTMVATLLDLPLVTDITKLEVEGGSATVQREIAGGHEVLKTALPAFFTTNKGLNQPRYTSIKGIMKAKKKKIAKVEAGVAEAYTSIQTMEAPPERQGGRIVGEGVEAVAELVRLLREEAKAL